MVELPILSHPPRGDIMERPQEEVESIVRNQIEQVQSLLDPDIDPRAKLHLDTTKIAWHKPRVDAWLAGERVAPITIDMALTQKCSYACTFCYAGLQQNPSEPVPWSAHEGFLDDCVEIGHTPGENVRAISLVSDGESTENPNMARFVSAGRERGIDMALGTNGYKMSPEEMPQLVRDLTYQRFNFDAGEEEAYKQIMGAPPKGFAQVTDNIRDAVRLKKEQGSSVTIGLQMVLLPQYADQVIPLALLGRELGVDYTVIKHCSDDEEGSLGVDYDWYRADLAQKLLRTAEALSTEDHSVQAKWSKLKTGRDRTYAPCFGTPFLLQMSGSGIVAPCGSFFNERYGQYHMGDIAKERFKDIWSSERYWSVMSHLGSDQFDARTQCETLCLQDKVNEALFDLKVNDIPLADVSGQTPPQHINFI